MTWRDSAIVGAALVGIGCSVPNPAYDVATTGAQAESSESGRVPNPVTTTTSDDGATADGDGTEVDGGFTDTTDSPPPETCAVGRVCEALPAGWLPVARPGVASPEVCPPGSRQLALLESEPIIGCFCGCEAPETGCSVQWQLNAPACAELQVGFGCVGTSGFGTSGEYLVELIPPACTVSAGLVVEQAPTLERICEPNELGPGCAQGQWCAPTGGGCLITEGRAQCPAAFPRREVLASEWSEPDCLNECDPCAHGCAEVVSLWDGVGCAGEQTDIPPSPDCHPTGDTAFYSISYDPEPTCDTAETVEVPAVADTEWTLCCRA